MPRYPGKREKCVARNCRRHVYLFALENETPEGDGWSRVSLQLGADVYLCPVHGLELREYGTVSPAGRKGNWKVISGLASE